MERDAYELEVFVYGTLKAGEPNAALGAGAAERVAAAAPGMLWLHPAGYPMLDAPADAVLGHASGDEATDRRRFERAARAHEGTAGPTDAPLVHGELLGFRERHRALEAFDDLEDFDPADPAGSEYHRVLLPVRVAGRPRLRVAWGYILPPDSPLRGRLPRWRGAAWSASDRA